MITSVGTGLPFTKMHGLGNDYVYIDGFEHEVADPAALARAVADRHRGVGGDGLILVLPPDDPAAADVRMRMFNADGSESEMCGNGIRCVCKFAHDRGLSRAQPMRVETGAGRLELEYELDADDRVSRVRVDMGRPSLDVHDIPADPTALEGHDGPEHRIVVDDVSWRCALVSMGNPHAVFFVDDLDAIDLVRIGPLIEHHAAFPRRINAHFVRVDAPDVVTMKTWERGSGITQACGTGASAVCVAGVVTGRTERLITAHLPGGPLELEWSPSTEHVFMTGPATEVFTGVFNGVWTAACS